jgi:hypothetical protein
MTATQRSDEANQPKEKQMHYRNGREAKNGDRIVTLDHEGKVQGHGILHGATPGDDYCNGSLALIPAGTGVCMIDALHVDDLAALLKEKGLDKRPSGK